MSSRKALGIVLAIVIAGEAFADMVSRYGYGLTVLVSLVIAASFYARFSNKQKQ